jgi:hypothetical protein
MTSVSTISIAPADEPNGPFVRVVRALSILKSLELWRLVMVFVSGLTTFIGMVLLYDSFGSDHGNAMVGSLRYVIPPAFAGTLHVMIYYSLERAASLRSWKYVVLAAPLQLIAVFVSFGAHWMHMRGDNYTVEDFKREQTAIVRGIQEFVQSYQAMAAASARLAEHSILEAKNEAEGPGNSCGMTVGTGRGPRFELRLSDRDTFSSFSHDIADKVKQLEVLAEQAEGVSAGSADAAVRRQVEFRRIVNQAKLFETDPLLREVRQSAADRVQKGRGTIQVPSQRRGKTETFTCPDAVLEHHLATVINAIDGLKKVPEAEFKNATDVRVGAVLAWQRLLNSAFGGQYLMLDLVREWFGWPQQSRGGVTTAEKLSGEDLGPLAVAFAVEVGLSLLFLFRRGALPNHPGLSELRKLVAQGRDHVFDSVWAALGGDDARGAVREVISRFTKFVGKSTLVVVPVYSNDPAVRLLHELMHVLVHVELAKLVSTGRSMKPILGLGWTDIRRFNALNHGAVRVYRMSAGDYLALILDAVHSTGPDQTRAITSNDGPLTATNALVVSPRGINARNWRRPGA